MTGFSQNTAPEGGDGQHPSNQGQIQNLGQNPMQSVAQLTSIPPPQVIYDKYQGYYTPIQQLPALPAYYHPPSMLRSSLVGRPVLAGPNMQSMPNNLNNMNAVVMGGSVQQSSMPQAANLPPATSGSISMPQTQTLPEANFRAGYQVYGQQSGPTHLGTPPGAHLAGSSNKTPSLNRTDYKADRELKIEPKLEPRDAPREAARDDMQGMAGGRNSSAYTRKRLLTACDTCRQKKSKCDNVRPRCGACARSGNTNCRYRADDPAFEYLAYDPASLNILLKLDEILFEIKGAPPRKKQHRERRHGLAHIMWDMSLTQLIRWPYLQKAVATTPDTAGKDTRRLVRSYENANATSGTPNVFQEWITVCDSTEKLLYLEFSSFASLFLLNCHTKVPCIDTVQLLECIEAYTLMKRADEELTFVRMLDEYANLPSNETVPQLYVDALAKFDIPDSPVRQRSYRECCECVPLLLVICAIGALATPLKLDNLDNFKNSMGERTSIETCCTNLKGVDTIIPRDRYQISRMLVTFALIISSIYPSSLRANSLVSVQYHILLSQYNMYLLNPLHAHREIVLASTQMMYYLESQNQRGESGSALPGYAFNGKRLVVDRLFWTCLKLECELRVELSPYVPLSGITQIVPPSPFLRIPEPLLIEDHLPECIKLANKFDDNNTWFFFLTEIAVRKVDNKLFDELYLAEGMETGVWDLANFAEKTVWSVSIKYLNQYNGIILSLSPKIRSFVLLEVNVEEIYASMKKRAEKKSRKIKEDIFDNLDDFLIDEDLILRAQSESIMFIKTRILTSKLALFRPLIYLILEDKILFMEIVEAAAEVLPRQMSQSDQAMLQDQEDQSTLSSSVNNDSSNLDSSSSYPTNLIDGQMSYFDIVNGPFVYQKKYPDDDFRDLIEYTEGCDEFDENFIHIKDFLAARKRLLRVFVRNIITLPKLTIPKIALHRHAGSWYYIRNLVFGVILQYLLFKKVQDVLMHMMSTNSLPPNSQEMTESLNLVFSKETVAASLDYALLILNYWKDESPDCAVYSEYVRRCQEML